MAPRGYGGDKYGQSDVDLLLRALHGTAGLPPEARPGSATLKRAEDLQAQKGLRGQEAVRNHGSPDQAEPDSI